MPLAATGDSAVVTTTQNTTFTPRPRRDPSSRPTRAERSQETHELLLEAAGLERTGPEGERRKMLLDDVVLLNRGVAEAVANRYRGRGVAQEDLHQAALEGLVKAVQKFDPEVSPDLLTYAVPTIRGEIQRWFRDQSWMVRPPRRIQELQWTISRSTEELTQSLGREATDQELADHVGCSVAELDEAAQAFGCFNPPSLDRPLNDADGPTLGDTLDHFDEGTTAVEARAVLAPVVRRLPERDRRILYLRFFEDQSQRDIGEELGVTQMQVSRLLTRIFRDLREEIGSAAG